MIQENWPGPGWHRGGCGCGCARCRRRGGMIDRLARRSLSAALAHAQHGRGEAEEWGAEATRGASRDTLYACIRVAWEAPVPVANLPAQAPAAYRQPGEWLYRFWRIGEARPLYIGRITGGRVDRRVAEHRGYINKATYANRLARGAATARIAQALNPANPADLQRITVQAGRYVANFSFDSPCVAPTGARGNVQRSAALTAVVEKLYHSRSTSQFNLRSEPRFEGIDQPSPFTGATDLDRLAEVSLAAAGAAPMRDGGGRPGGGA